MTTTRTILTILVAFLFIGVTTVNAVGTEIRSIKRNTVNSEQRLALVIGNGGYANSPLKNPVNDARDMANVLKKTGFSVTLLTDGNQRKMEEAIQNLGDQLRTGGVGLFYFAGHGVQVRNTNYLIPVDAQIKSEADVRYEAVDANRILSQMEEAGNRMNLVFLDACRNNPYTRSFRSANQGLAQMDSPTGSMVAFATAPGSVAADGTGRNGIFTKYLIQAIQQPGIEIGRLMRSVRRNVQNETAGAQTPFELSSIVGDFYFSGGAQGQPGTAAKVRPSSSKPQYNVNADEELWIAVKGSTSLSDYEYFLSEYPNSPFAVTARLKVRKLKIPVKKVQQTLVPKAGDTYTDPTTGMEFAYVPGGCFQMGDTFGDGGSDEKPVHKVCLDGFYMGKYEVTQGEYRKIIGTNPSGFAKSSRYPVEKVSWHDAQTFISSLNSKNGGGVFRLPTEAEWEYAARSGGKNEKYSGSNNIDSVAWYDSNSNSSTHQVGTKSANGLGLYDMSGNVWEWCQDWYGENSYRSSAGKNPLGPSSGGRRVTRGGGWYHVPGRVRSALRHGYSPDDRGDGLGFRLVLQASSVPGR